MWVAAADLVSETKGPSQGIFWKAYCECCVQIRDPDPTFPDLSHSQEPSPFSKRPQCRLKQGMGWGPFGLAGCTLVGMGNSGLLAWEDTEANCPRLLGCPGSKRTGMSCWPSRGPLPSAGKSERGQMLLICLTRSSWSSSGWQSQALGATGTKTAWVWLAGEVLEPTWARPTLVLIWGALGCGQPVV